MPSIETATGTEADPAPPLSVSILPGNGLPAQSGCKHPAPVLRSCIHELELACRVYSSKAAPVIDTLEVLALALELTGNRPRGFSGSLPLRNTGKACVSRLRARPQAGSGHCSGVASPLNNHSVATSALTLPGSSSALWLSVLDPK